MTCTLFFWLPTNDHWYFVWSHIGFLPFISITVCQNKSICHEYLLHTLTSQWANKSCVKIVLDPWALIWIARSDLTTSEHRRTSAKLLTTPLYTAMSPNTRYVLSEESKCMANRIRQRRRSTCRCQRQQTNNRRRRRELTAKFGVNLSWFQN